MEIDRIVSIISDPRKDKNRKYSLQELVLIIFSSVISGYYEPDEMADFARLKLDWLRKFAPFEFRTPSHETLRYFLCAVKPSELIECFKRFVEHYSVSSQENVISIDGKTMRGTDVAGESGIHVISAWSHENGITLAALESEGKKNEIKMIPRLIDMLDVEGVTITTDAIGCQKEIAQKIIDSKNHYVLQLKKNHKHLYAEIEAYYHKLLREDFADTDCSTYETIEKGHGRIEVRKYTQFVLSDWVEGREEWSGLSSVIRVERTRIISEEESLETSWYLSSLSVDVLKSAKAIRAHWGIENGLHWCLDVIFEDDVCGMHSGWGPMNLSLIKRYCMNLLKLDSSKKRLKRKVMMAAMSDDYRQGALFG